MAQNRRWIGIKVFLDVRFCGVTVWKQKNMNRSASNAKTRLNSESHNKVATLYAGGGKKSPRHLQEMLLLLSYNSAALPQVYCCSLHRKYSY
jgi:hypothetical protein